MKANLIGGTFMKKITLKRQPLFRRQPEQAVVRPDLVKRLNDFVCSLTTPRDFLLELQRCLNSQQFKVQSLAIKKIATLLPREVPTARDDAPQVSEEARQVRETLGLLVHLLLSADCSSLHGSIVNLGKTIKPPSNQAASPTPASSSPSSPSSPSSSFSSSLYALLEQALRDQLSSWLTSLLRREGDEGGMDVEGDTAPDGPSFALAPKLPSLASLLEMDPAIAVLGSSTDSLCTILKYFTRYLQECLPLLDQSIATPASKQAIDDGEALLKTLIVAQTRFSAPLIDLYLNVPSSHVLFQSLFQCSLQVLRGLNENRDLVGPAGLCLCGFLKTLLLSDSIRAGSTNSTMSSNLLAAFQHELAATFFAAEPTEGQSGSLSAFLAKLERNDEDILFPFEVSDRSLREHFLRFSPHARLAIYRGVIISLPRETITAPFKIPGRERNVTILWDFLFTELCRICGTGGEILTRRFAFQTLADILQTIKDLLTASVPSLSPDAVIVPFQATRDLFFDDLQAAILDLVWLNWNDSSESIVQQVSKIFEYLLDVFDTLRPVLLASARRDRYEHFFTALVERLLHVEDHVKAKYTTIQLLLNRLGAHRIITIKQDFFPAMLRSVKEPTARNAASRVVESFLGSLYAECKKAHENDASPSSANEAALAECRRVWVGPTVELLCSLDKNERQGMVLYALPSILAVFPQETAHLLHAIAQWSAAKRLREEARDRKLRSGGHHGETEEEEEKEKEAEKEDREGGPVKITSEGLRGFISVLKTARKMGLIEARHLEGSSDDDVASQPAGEAEPAKDAEPVKTTKRGDSKAATTTVSINLSSAQSGFDLPVPSLIRIALGHSDEELRTDAVDLISVGKKTIENPTYFELDMMKYFLWVNIKASSQALRQGAIPKIGKFLQRLKDCVYAEQKKKHEQSKRKKAENEEEEEVLVTDFLRWYQSFISFALYPSGSYQRKSTAVALYRELLNVFGADKEGDYGKLSSFDAYAPVSTSALVLTLWDDIDSMRHSAFAVLGGFPSPLPGFTDPIKVAALMRWALWMMNSPRTRETDTGSLVFRLILIKYVLPLGWFIQVDEASVTPHLSHSSEFNPREFGPSQFFFSETISQLERHIAGASVDLVAASQRTPIHGPLLAIRYMIQDINFKSLKDRKQIADWRIQLERLLACLRKATNLVLPIVSAISPEGLTSAQTIPEEYEINTIEGESDIEYGTPQGQYLAVCAWLSIKEVGLLLGCMINAVPVPSPQQKEAVLGEDGIKEAGDLFMHIMLSSRHRGALEKSYLGFQLLSENLLSCAHPGLYSLPGAWIQHLLKVIENDDFKSITRRSAGLPYCFCAILRAETIVLGRRRSGVKVLIAQAMQALLRIATGGDTQQLEIHPDVTEVKKEISEQAQVHALNVLKALFRDSALRLDVIPYLSDAIIIALNGYTSTSWGIRNSSTMNFSTIVERVVAPKMVRDEQSKKNAATFPQFFARFPRLYPFLLQKFQEQITLGEKRDNAIMYSSIYPMLVLLSRLMPSTLKSKRKVKPGEGSRPQLSPEAFIPLVAKCSANSNFKVRQMAARALVPLVPPENVAAFITSHFNSIPDSAAIDHNLAHGTLLQIQHILEAHLASNNAVLKSSIVEAAVASVEAKEGLLLGLRCPPVQSEFLSIVASLVPFSSALKERSARWVSSLLAKKSDVAQPLVSTMGHIMSATLRRQAATLELAAIAEGRETPLATTERATDRLLHLIEDQDYEVRALAIKFAVKALKSDQSLLFDWKRVQGTLLERMHAESHHACVKHLLSLLYAFPVPLPDAALFANSREGDEQAGTFFGHLRAMLDRWPNGATRENVISLMGVYLAQLLNRKEEAEEKLGAGAVRDMLSVWSDIIQQHSVPEMEWSFRFAVARSIRASGVCEYKPSAHKTGKELAQALELTSLRAWAIVVRLLEDDDDAVRNEAAFLVSETVTLSSSSSSSVFATFASFSASSALLSPTAAFELAFAYLSEHFASSAFYLLFLLQLLGLETLSPQQPSIPGILPPQPQEDVMEIESPAAPEGDASGMPPPPPSLSRLAAALLAPLTVRLPAPEASTSFDPARFEHELAYLSKGEAWGSFGNILFEKEADNWYEEDLLRVQMAAKHLPIAISSFTEGEDHAAAAELVRDFLQRTAAHQAALLKRAAAWLARQQDEGTTVWGKWASYQRHVFIFAARLLTVVAVLLPHIPSPHQLEGDLNEASASLARLESFNPMLAHVAGLIQQSLPSSLPSDSAAVEHLPLAFLLSL